MGTKISWTDETWNPVVGCTKCSPGCKNCYAERMAHRLKCICVATNNNPQYLGKTDEDSHWTGEVECCDWLLEQPLHWRNPRKIFVCSMGDLFHEKVPSEFITNVLRVTEKCPQHTFQILTKRVQVAYDFFGGISGFGLSAPPLPNLHLGVSISTQKEADEKIPILLQILAAVRWLSIEPMLEYIYIPNDILFQLDWIVLGCESGPGRRPCSIGDMRDMVHDFTMAGVAVLVKQVPMPYCKKEFRGKWAQMPSYEELDGMNSIKNYVSHDPKEWPQDLRIQQCPDGPKTKSNAK